VPTNPTRRIKRKSGSPRAAPSRRASSKKTSLRGRKQASTGFAALSLGLVALALVALLGILLLRSSPSAGVAAQKAGAETASTVEQPAEAVPAEGATEDARQPASGAQPEAAARPKAPTEPATTTEPATVPSEPATAVEPAKTARPPESAEPPGGSTERPKTGPAPAAKTAAYRPEASSRPKLPQNPTAPRVNAREILFVIDDAGYNMKQLKPFLELPFPVTIAVLPGLQYSEKAARAVRAAGKELILHQPMEAIGGQNPGPGAIRLGMGAKEIERIVDANLATVPGAVGINNHMGSAATADLSVMEAVAAVAKKRGIYYLDSRTTSASSVPVAARREGISYWERDVFLDNTPDRASILRAVEDGKKRSSKDRPAIMIGHVWSAELAQTLSDLYPQLVSEGYSLSTISRFMVEEASGDEE
jgi:uncharacterized protein